MPWDAEDADEAYLDHLATHESGFLGDDPPEILTFDQAVEQIAVESGAIVQPLHSETRAERLSRLAHRLKVIATRHV
jgi:hypothetical protein